MAGSSQIAMAKEPPITLKEGDKAPDFQALDQHGEQVSLKKLRGEKVLLYFYPKDNTPGCTKEACAFRDNFPRFGDLGIRILGVSPDSAKSHQKFTQKFDLPFQLLVDEEKTIVQSYGVWGEKMFMGRTFDGTFRASFLIDEKGKVEKIWPKVKAETHPVEVLEFLQQ